MASQAKTPQFTPVYAPNSHIGGYTGDLLQAITDQWLLIAPKANPAMLEMFADRDHPPYRNLLPWSGEFAGKYLTSAVQVWRVTRHPGLKAWLDEFVSRLIQLQDADGYLGPWPRDSRLTNFSAHHGQEGLYTWDTWGHYHIMIGLMLWHEETGDQQALECACRIADLICQKYLGKVSVRLVDTGYTEMNLAPAHALARLYRLTGTEKYLRMALQIVDEFGAVGENSPLAGDYLNAALAGKAFYECPRPRWESLHPIMALVELFYITGEERYRQAFESIWWSIVEYDRHNNGGFSSGEKATGNPYDPAAIETCCTIAWLALSVEMLKLSGNSVVADEIELSTVNSVLGMHSPTGRWATYNTPSDGARFASAHQIVFQARSGSPELNCCSVNSPRGLGLLSEWALMQAQEGLILNYYGPSRLDVSLGDGLELTIRQETDYPRCGHIAISMTPSRSAVLPLRLRIPSWSQETHLRLNGETQTGIQPGTYYEIRREWSPGDAVELDLDMRPHIWPGERQCQGLVSIYRGPLLLAYDQRYNRREAGNHPGINIQPIPDEPWKVNTELLKDILPVLSLDARRLALEPVAWEGWFPPQLLLRAQAADGQPLWLCDFASAGATGTLYRTWLPLSVPAHAQGFSRQNPLRRARL